VFVRTDLPGAPRVPALLGHADRQGGDVRRTRLAAGGVRLSTCEHVLAALAGLGVDNAEIRLDGEEPPEPDGSALPFALAILEAGIVEQDAPRRPLAPPRPVTVEDWNRSIRLEPAERLELAYRLHYDHPAVGTQELAWTADPDRFVAEIAPARTFALEEEVAELERRGLARGGSLDNAIVVGPKGPLNPGPLRFPDELVRHKILDLLGDLSLLGRPLRARVSADRSGHSTNVALAARVLAIEEAGWDTGEAGSREGGGAGPASASSGTVQGES
jgi:UDP-3-O-[3-hydroxymyristoyl] N-acetylglucosamine deacetylase